MAEEDRPRMPRNMKGLIKFCMEATKSEDPTTASNFDAMPEEKRKWLNGALDGMSVSPVKRMRECIKILQEDEETKEMQASKQAAMGELIDWCEHIDFSRDFHKIGGYSLFPKMFQSPDPDLRRGILELIAVSVQNNPYCQHAVVQSNLMPELLRILDSDEDNGVRIKALYAVSCLSRDLSDAQDEFAKHDGFSVLMRAMQTNVEKLKVKAAFMISSMCFDRPAFKDTFCDIGMIDQLVGHLSEQHNIFHEHLMAALLAIVTDHQRALDECLRPEMNLRSLLQQKLVFLQGKEEFEEELQFTQDLLKIIANRAHKDDTDTEVNR